MGLNDMNDDTARDAAGQIDATATEELGSDADEMTADGVTDDGMTETAADGGVAVDDTLDNTPDAEDERFA